MDGITTSAPRTEPAKAPVLAPAKPHVPLRERVNIRILAFSLLIIAPIVWFGFEIVRGRLTQGIEDFGNGLTKIDLKFMSTFPFDGQTGKLSDVPEQFRKLNGNRVVLDGEMWAPNAAGPDVNEFQLCYSVAKCCFSGPPQVQHFVDSRVTGGGAVPYYSGVKVRVIGTLHVNVKFDPEVQRVTSVYQMDVESVEPFN